MRKKLNCTGIRKENIGYNNNRIEEANNERELWNVANDVLNPKKENDWNIQKDNGEFITKEKEVAESFNEFFINKVENLKNNIDPANVEDPLVRLFEKLKDMSLFVRLVYKKELRTTIYMSLTFGQICLIILLSFIIVVPT